MGNRAGMGHQTLTFTLGAGITHNKGPSHSPIPSVTSCRSGQCTVVKRICRGKGRVSWVDSSRGCSHGASEGSWALLSLQMTRSAGPEETQLHPVKEKTDPIVIQRGRGFRQS